VYDEYMNLDIKLLLVSLLVGFISLGYVAVVMLTPEDKASKESIMVFPETIQFEIARDELLEEESVAITSAVLATKAGEALVVDNLLGTSGLTETSNDGLYEYRAGDTFNSRYTIAYHEFDGSIIVSLQSQPLANVRREAEQALLQLTRLPQSTLCELTILVTTPISVSQTFSGQNLGLSFCPGSVPL
jgi:hypothetical protein